MSRTPIPESLELTEGFWDAARRGRLVTQRCLACGRRRHYPQLRCAHCLSPDWDWSPIPGRGVIHSYTVTHRAFHPSWADRVPYVVATIELEDGIRMVTDLDEPIDDVRIGAPVVVVFDRIDDAHTLPRFRLLRQSAGDRTTED